MELYQGLRLYDNRASVNQVLTDLSAKISPNDIFYFGGGMRYTRNRTNSGDFENNMRFNFDVGLKHKVDRFTFKYRLRLQARNELGYSQEDGVFPDAPPVYVPCNLAYNGNREGALSIDMSDASNSWPLLSYIIADETYEDTYKAALLDFIDNHFYSAKMSTTYNAYKDLIEPYVTGTEGEQDGYTFLNSSSDFSIAVSELISHAGNQWSAAYSYAQ